MPINAAIPLGFKPTAELMNPQQMMSLQQMAQQGQMQRQAMDEKNQLRSAFQGATDPASGRLSPEGIGRITQINPQLGLQLTEQQERLRLQDIAFNEKKNEVAVRVGTTYVSAYDRYLQQTGGNKEQALNLARADTLSAIDELDRSGQLRLVGLDPQAIAGLRNLQDPEKTRTIVTSLGGKVEKPGVAAEKPSRRDFTDASWAEYERTGNQGVLRKLEAPKEPRNVQTYESDAGLHERQPDGTWKLVAGPDGKPLRPKGTAERLAKEAEALAKGKNEQENKMRDDFTKASGEFVKVRDAHQRLLESADNPSAAGDMALIFNFMKVLDPGSTVREGEFATAQNAGGIPDRIRGQYNKVMSGERLAPDVRKDFVDRSDKLYKGALTNHESIEKDFEEKAKRAGVRPEQIVTRHRITPKSAAPEALEAKVKASGWTYEPAKYEYRVGPNGQVQRKLRG